VYGFTEHTQKLSSSGTATGCHMASCCTATVTTPLAGTTAHTQSEKHQVLPLLLLLLAQPVTGMQQQQQLLLAKSQPCWPWFWQPPAAEAAARHYMTAWRCCWYYCSIQPAQGLLQPAGCRITGGLLPAPPCRQLLPCQPQLQTTQATAALPWALSAPLQVTTPIQPLPCCRQPSSQLPIGARHLVA
jgi:hypothetical protein